MPRPQLTEAQQGPLREVLTRALEEPITLTFDDEADAVAMRFRLYNFIHRYGPEFSGVTISKRRAALKLKTLTFTVEKAS